MRGIFLNTLTHLSCLSHLIQKLHFSNSNKLVVLGTISVYFLNTLGYLVWYKKPGKFSCRVRRRQIRLPWQWGVCSCRWGRWLQGEQTMTWVASQNRSSPSDWPNTRIFQLRSWWRSNTCPKHDNEITLKSIKYFLFSILLYTIPFGELTRKFH